MVDEAHSLGVLGEKGHGIVSHFGVDAKEIDICMGTLSKTLASAGGYIVGDRALVELLRTYTPGFLYSVGISPPVAAAALEALKIMQTEPERVTALHENGLLFLHKAKEKGINTGLSEGYSVIPVIVGSSIKSGRLADAMFKRGINVQPIFYPAVEEKSARLRFFISSAHTEMQIIQTVEILSEELQKLF
jgi:8-amino-7-oxononanoate synthase